jgi:lipid II:glycine glycyltransferase (peptidoglycan interpeptide bridge formation enzyme)
MIDLRQTKEYANYMETIGWKVERIENTNYFIKTLPLLGSVLKIQRPKELSSLVFEQIRSLEKKYRVFQTIVEPSEEADSKQLMANDFKQSKSPYLPSKTIHIDVAKNDSALLSAMHYKTRYNIKNAQRNDVWIETSQDIKTFATLWQIEAKERGFFLSQENEINALYTSFGAKTQIIFAHSSSLRANEMSVAISNKNKSSIEIASSQTPRNDILGGILLLFTKDICYYMYAFSTKEGKKLFAPTLLVWEALQIAKKKKVNFFDFEGIFDERFPLPKWKGFSRFKQSFGGEEVTYPGAFVKWRLPML